MSASPQLDHLVYAVPNLSTAMADFHAKLGVAPTLGGRHEGIGTHNAILPLGTDCYLELIAADPEQPTPSYPRPFGIDQLTEPRLVTWALRVREIEATVERSRAAGYDPGIVLDVSRRQPTGSYLSWKLSLRPEPFGDGLVPFLIDWGETRHPAAGGGACSLAVFRAQHPDPAPIQTALSGLGASLDITLGETARLEASVLGPGGGLELS